MIEIKAQLVAAHLTGTCISLQTAIESVLDEDDWALEDDLEFCLAIDDRVFCCSVCEWWCENSEMAREDGQGFICFECDE